MGDGFGVQNLSITLTFSSLSNVLCPMGHSASVLLPEVLHGHVHPVRSHRYLNQLSYVVAIAPLVIAHKRTQRPPMASSVSRDKSNFSFLDSKDTWPGRGKGRTVLSRLSYLPRQARSRRLFVTHFPNATTFSILTGSASKLGDGPGSSVILIY